jgi:SEC-C motif
MTLLHQAPKVGRNQPCPCGSGKKYKRCHGGTHANGDPAASLVGFANQLVLKTPNLDILHHDKLEVYTPLARMLQEKIKQYDAANKLILPDLSVSGNQTAAIFSDYSGEGPGDYHTYSILVCGWNLLGAFHKRMQVIRARHKLGTKEIAFKDFRMGQLQRALPEYLTAVNNLLPGFLLTLAVHKNVLSLFGPSEKATRTHLAEVLGTHELGTWKPDVAEKLLRITHLAAFLSGLLVHNGQKIFWMTDHDAIAANDTLHQNALKLFGRILPLYTRPGYTFPLLGGARPFEERSVAYLDALSVPDIVAGSIEQLLTQRDRVPFEDIRVKEGCDKVLKWLAHDGIGLKKMNLIVKQNESATLEAGTLVLSLVDPPADLQLIPIFVRRAEPEANCGIPGTM